MGEQQVDASDAAFLDTGSSGLAGQSYLCDLARTCCAVISSRPYGPGEAMSSMLSGMAISST